MRSHQRGALFLLPALLVGLGAAVILAPSGPSVSAASATNACKSNATATFSDIAIGLTGTAAVSGTTAGTDTITLSGVKFTAAVPATLLIAGYNLGLLAAGANVIPVKGWVGISGTGSTEATQELTFTSSVTTTITDPNGLPGTGDETATPLSLNLSLADTTWTAPTGTVVNFAQAGPGSLAAIPAGQVAPGAVTPVGGIYINAQVAGGLVKANFDCQAGTTTISPPGGSSGITFTPATPSPFATVNGPPLPTTTTGASTTTTDATTTTGAATTTSPPDVTTTTPPPVSGTGTFNASCEDNVFHNKSNVVFNASGQAPSQVAADTKFTVSAMKWSLTIPASVFSFGLSQGLITVGTPIDGSLDLSITGTKTAQGTLDVRKIKLSVPIAANAAGEALPSTVNFDVPDMAWTALSGKMDFVMHGATITVVVGPTLPKPLIVQFECKVTDGGSFLTSTASGVSTIITTTTTTTTAVASASATTATGSLVVTGPRNDLWIQLLLALVLLDLGYLTLSLRRKPRHP